MMTQFLKSLTIAVVLAASAGWLGYQRGQHVLASQTIQPDGAVEATQPLGRLSLDGPIIGVNYFGRNGAKNVINSFRIEEVAEDFSRLRADGFNTVVLPIFWTEFQPTYDPCCTYDERVFDRLSILMNEANKAGLSIILRIGYSHPYDRDSPIATYRLLNDAQVRQSFFAFLAQVKKQIRPYLNVRLNILAQGELDPHLIDFKSLEGFHNFLDGLPINHPRRSYPRDKAMPTLDGVDKSLFAAYWDWLLLHELYQPASARLPRPIFEERIDRDPPRYADANDNVRLIGDETTFAPLGAEAMGVNVAPILFDRHNDSQSIDTAVLDESLAKVRQYSDLPMWIDQVDLSVLAEGHSTSVTERFLCELRQASTLGYAYWSAHDYADSLLNNSSFAIGLKGWTMTTTDGTLPHDRFEQRASGDRDLRLHTGDALKQTIFRSNRTKSIQQKDSFAAQACLYANANSPAVLDVYVGAEAERFNFSSAGAQRICHKVSVTTEDQIAEFRIIGVSGAPALTSVTLFESVREGGVYTLDNLDGRWVSAIRMFNQHLKAKDANSDCR